jgi:hypothetical protein
MALPSSGQISFADFNTDRGYPATDTVVMTAAASAFGVSYTTDGSNDLRMDEFYGKSGGLFDLYSACSTLAVVYIPWNNGSNPFSAEINGECSFRDQVGVTLPYIQANFPSATFYADYYNAGCQCGDEF